MIIKNEECKRCFFNQGKEDEKYCNFTTCVFLDDEEYELYQ